MQPEVNKPSMKYKSETISSTSCLNDPLVKNEPSPQNGQREDLYEI